MPKFTHREFRLENDWQSVTLILTDEVKDQIVEAVLAFYEAADCVSAESLGQSDFTFIEGPGVLVELADSLPFEVVYKDDD